MYGSSAGTTAEFDSYSLASATDVRFSSTLAMGGSCSPFKALFVMVASESPYAVYGTLFGNNTGFGFGKESIGPLFASNVASVVFHALYRWLANAH